MDPGSGIPTRHDQSLTRVGGTDCCLSPVQSPVYPHKVHTWLLIFHPLFSYFYLHFLHSVFISPEIIHTSVFCKPSLSSSLPPSCLTSIFVSVSHFVSMCLGLVAQSCPAPPTHCTAARWAPLSMEFSRQEYWSGLPSPPPGIFLTQESNSGLLHCWQTLN